MSYQISIFTNFGKLLKKFIKWVFPWSFYEFKKTLLIFVVGFCVYPTIEIVWNTILTPFGYKIFIGLFSMGILGGVLLVILGHLNEIKTVREKWPPWVQAIVGGCIITILEFLTGLIVNRWLNWNVWDYTNLPFNFMGQVCLLYSVFWVFLAPLAFWIDDIFRLGYDKIMNRSGVNKYMVESKKNYITSRGPGIIVPVGSTTDLKHRYVRIFKRNLYKL